MLGWVKRIRINRIPLFFFKAQRDWSIFRGHRKAVFQRQWKGRSSTAAAIPTSHVSQPFHIHTSKTEVLQTPSTIKVNQGQGVE